MVFGYAEHISDIIFMIIGHQSPYVDNATYEQEMW